jgi:hypothetical protein
MQVEEKILFCLIVLLGIASLASMTLGQNEATGPINASISQPISINTSGNLTVGIFFTNGTQIGIQYPITNVTIENNATGNYWGASYGTEYYVGSSVGNTINITIGFTACDNLRNSTLGAYINLTWDTGDGGQGAFFGNSTTSATAPSLTVSSDYAFKVDAWTIPGPLVSPGQKLYLRFWLDPWPNNVPSGIYNTTYKIRAVEYNTSLGSAVC